MLTTLDVAQQLGRSVRTINLIASKKGIGTLATGRLFSAKDVAQLRKILAARKPGRPTKDAAMKRSGFTLVELMVVIVIIGVLAAVLFPAINGAITAARDTEAFADIKSFESEMAAFKNRFGIMPPSWVALPEDAAAWETDWNVSPPVAGLTEQHRRVSRALIRQLWPDFDFLYGGTTAAPGTIDINDDGDGTDFLVLNGAECLAFFCGGVPERVDINQDGVKEGWNTTGFSANPQSPFSRGGNRVGPFGNFYVDRFMDIDAEMGINLDEKMPEYRDPYPGQRTPYQYLAGYDTGSRPFGLDYDPATGTNLSTTDDELIPRPRGLADAYWLTSVSGRPQYIKAGQIVSPGADGEFGDGGYYNGMSVPSDRAYERDNITSFRNNRLQ